MKDLTTLHGEGEMMFYALRRLGKKSTVVGSSHGDRSGRSFIRNRRDLQASNTSGVERPGGHKFWPGLHMGYNEFGRARGAFTVRRNVKTRCLISLAVLLFPLNGLLCRMEDGDAGAMACCRGQRASHCNTPQKTEDCCKGKASPDKAIAVSLDKTSADAGRGLVAALPPDVQPALPGSTNSGVAHSIKLPDIPRGHPLVLPLRI